MGHKFTVKPPKPPVPPPPISIQVRDCGGHEGVQIEVTSQCGLHGPHAGLLAIDPEGNVWTGDCFHIKVGSFTPQGCFIWELGKR